MSGTGVPDFLAPTRLTPVAADQAIGKGADGSDVMPSMYFSQMIQRILSFLGQPASSSNGTTLSDQVVAVTEIANTALQVATSAAGTAVSLAAVFDQKIAEISGGTLPPFPPPPTPEIVSLILPLPPPPGLSFPQVMAIGYFGF